MKKQINIQDKLLELNKTVWKERFYNYLIKKEYSEKTITGYITYIDKYLDFTFKNGLDIGKMTQKDFDKFEDTINGRVSKSIVQSVLRTFHRYLERDFNIKAPAIHMDLPRPEKSVQYTPTREELEKIRQAVEKTPHAKLRARNKAIVEIFLSTGIREGELTKIKIKDIENTLESIKISGKGKKERWVILSHDASLALSNYLKFHDNPIGNNYLFYASGYSQGERKLAHTTIVYLFSQLKKLAGIDYEKSITPHGIRRAFATQLAEQGTEIHLIRQLLGHSSIDTTSRYINSSMETIKNKIQGHQPFNTEDKKPSEEFLNKIKHA